MSRLVSMVLAVATFALLACGPGATSSTTEEAAAPEGPSQPAGMPRLEISSTAFESGGAIPARYTCVGDNVSPPLAWSGLPEGTETLALLVDDLDSSPPGFSHWVIYNIPAAETALEENVPRGEQLADGSRQGSNDFAAYGPGAFPGGAAIKLVGYDGPCPPRGEHRYVFTLYALDTSLDLPAEGTAADVEAAMEGHILAQGELVGLYARP